MGTGLLERYIWLVDTIRRHKRIKRSQLDELWRRSPYSGGRPLARRTFYNYRAAIAGLFGLEIEIDRATYEYYIKEERLGDRHSLADHLLDSAAMGSLMADAGAVEDLVFVEDVPSAREWLGPTIHALKEHRPMRFTYHSYVRAQPQTGVVLEPYFVKLFRQRWYATGRETTSGRIKTYALDRMSDVEVCPETFDTPPGFDAGAFVRDSFGIVFSHAEARTVTIRATPNRAKYLRALPLHPSQSEMVGNGCSYFTYRLKLTPDLVQEILSHGPDLTVTSPPELRAMVTTALRESLAHYDEPTDTTDQ